MIGGINMNNKLNVKVHIETMFEDRPIELAFIKQAIKEKRERILSEMGSGCPANNTNCRYLIDNVCIHVMPELKDKNNKISCGSFKL